MDPSPPETGFSEQSHKSYKTHVVSSPGPSCPEVWRGDTMQTEL